MDASGPNWAQIGQLIVGLLGLIALIVGFAFAYWQLHTSKQVAQADLLFRLGCFWDRELGRAKLYSREFREPEAMTKKLGELERHSIERDRLLSIADFMELLGVHYENRSLSLKLIYEFLGSSVSGRWRIYGDYVAKERAKDPQNPDPTLYEWFENLAKAIDREENRRKEIRLRSARRKASRERWRQRLIFWSSHTDIIPPGT